MSRKWKETGDRPRTPYAARYSLEGAAADAPGALAAAALLTPQRLRQVRYRGADTSKAVDVAAARLWESLRPLTRLRQALGKLNVTMDVPEPVELLGIPADLGPRIEREVVEESATRSSRGEGGPACVV